MKPTKHRITRLKKGDLITYIGATFRVKKRASRKGQRYVFGGGHLSQAFILPIERFPEGDLKGFETTEKGEILLSAFDQIVGISTDEFVKIGIDQKQKNLTEKTP